MADTKISALTAVATPAGTDEFAVNQSSSSKKITLSQIKTALPTLPTIASVGAEFTSTGVPTATLPGTHAADDILVLVLQSSNDSAVTPPTGYNRLGPQNGVGAAATAGSTKLSVFWKRDGGAESAPTIPDTGDHTYGMMIAVRGCRTQGDPFHLLGQAFKFTASTTGTATQAATLVDNSLIMTIFAHAIDSTTAQGSSPTNADLTSVTEQFDDSTDDGTGGGIYIMTGVKQRAGPFTTSTVTWAASTLDVSTTVAWVPADAATITNKTQVQTFIGSTADLDDTWTKPSGAAHVRVQLCDGGGSGSSGNTTTTAAGGGGGGGGAYGEAFFDSDALADTITVHAGKGGAAPTALNQAGNVGVVSEFDKSGNGPLVGARRSAGTAATAAASADGGNGGCGAGCQPGPIAVQTSRRALNGANANCANSYLGAGGGSGNTASVGGSEAVYGGGGGESGSDTDAAITSANNGNSLYGGGGGAGGRTNTNVSGSGAGGGAAGVSSANGAAGTDSAKLPYGGSGGCGGGSGTVTGGKGGFPGGGGGGGGGVAGGFGGEGGHGCVVVTTYF